MADLERVCDYLIVLVDSRVRLVGDIDELLASHRQLVGPRRDGPCRAPGVDVTARHTDRQTTLLVRAQRPIDDPGWTVAGVGLEDLVLAYMKVEPANLSPMEVAR